jgi:[acyl-carrier-protein] S-malonyltransferase
MIADPSLQIIGNVNASVIRSGEELRADIKSQMQSRVRWTETIQYLSNQKVATFVEAGTGNVLAGLIRRINPSAFVLPLGNPIDFAALE